MSYKSYLRSYLIHYRIIFWMCGPNGGGWEIILYKHWNQERASEWGKQREKVRISQQWSKNVKMQTCTEKHKCHSPKSRSGRIHLNIILYCISNRLDITSVCVRCSQQCLKQFAFSCRRDNGQYGNKGEAAKRNHLLSVCRIVLHQFIVSNYVMVGWHRLKNNHNNTTKV